MKVLQSVLACSVTCALAMALACSSGGGGGGGAPATGQSCSAASQCYPLVGTGDASAIQGTVTCLTQGISSGYCTHTCTSNADCCSAAGECPLGYAEVCAPFESTGQMYCFLSCDASAISAAADAGTTDPATYCQLYANASFTCRSTGGGKGNQQFCGP